MHKLDALTRILEAETFDGMLVFTRTKQSTVELAEKLEARGFAAAPLNGDIPQPQRERTVARLKAGQIDIVGRHRCGRARPRRRAHRPRRELRRAVRHRILRASHRPHRPGRTQGRGDPVHRSARAQHAARHRARHAAGHRADESADGRRGQRAANRQVQDSGSPRPIAKGEADGFPVRVWSNWRRKPVCRSSTLPPRSRACRRARRRCCWRRKPNGRPNLRTAAHRMRDGVRDETRRRATTIAARTNAAR